MSKTKNGKSLKKTPLHTADGRINPDKAIALCTEVIRSMTPQEVRKLANTPVVLKGSDGRPLKEQKKD